MAKKSSTKKAQSKSSTDRGLNAPRYNENRRATNKNATGTRLSLNNSADAMRIASEYVDEFFNVTSNKWVATNTYGLQHFNQDGVLHRDGITRLSNESLAIMALQLCEALAQRAAQKGNKSFIMQMGEGGDPAIAQNTIDLIRRFLNERPGDIKKDRQASIYGSVMADLGINDTSEIVAKTPKTSKKVSSKKTSKKASSKKEEATAEANT